MRTCLILACLFFTSSLVAADATNDSPDESEGRKTAERFLMVLERNPRKGTALDKVVAFHLDHESLDELVSQLREKASSLAEGKPEESGRAWLVVGMIDDSRAETELAVEAFKKAEQLLPKSSVASYSLGQALVSLNRLSDGAAAFERAIQRQPVPTDLLEIFQSLGRAQQRLAPGDKVIEVWARLEKLVPNAPRVPELIARTLLDDGYWEAALPRYESLAKGAKDPYRRSELELEILDLRLKLGQTEKALADADRLLSNLKPEHWLFRETRRRVEEAFLVQDDVAGWIKHLESRLATQPGDIDAVVRLARALAGLNRNDEARSRLEAAIKVAPNSADLRVELIELLKSQQLVKEAISQYEQLDRIAPNNTDYVRDWGLLVIKAPQFVVPPSGGHPADSANQNKHGLKAELRTAAAIWLKLVNAKPKDAVVAAQVADWMVEADTFLLDDAAGLLRKAVDLEPDSLSHREQFGEVLATAGKKDESLAMWRTMANGPRRTANNLAHLSEVLNRFGYRDETLTTIDAACELDRKSLELRFQQAEVRRNWKQFESAMSALAEAAMLADTPETFDRVVQVEVRVLTESELLTERIEELQAVTSKMRERVVNDDHSLARRASSQHFRLAKYLEAASNLKEATVAARKAVELEPKNGVFLQAAAKMLAADSQWLSAVEVYERLLKLDRRFRIDSLRAIAEMELKLGRKERAMKSGRDLLSAAPANPEASEFVVDLCVHFGQQTEALQILRRASRQNPVDRRLAMKLVDRLMDGGGAEGHGLRGAGEGGTAEARSQKSDAAALAPQSSALSQSFDEAREVLWRVFEKSSKSDDRAEVAKKLGELSVLPREFVKLIARLERLRHEPKMARDAALALINVHEQAGDTQQARRELDRLLPSAPRDADLLKRAVALSESMGDLDAAITQQQRLADVVRRREADEHLMVLLRRAGRDGDANALLAKWTEQERDPGKVLREIDRILTTTSGRTLSSPGSRQADRQAIPGALKLVQQWRAREPMNWEFMVREVLLLAEQLETDKAKLVRDELLRLDLPDDTLSVLASAKKSPALVTDRIERMRRRFVSAGLPIVDYGQARQMAIDGRILLGTYWLDKRHPKNRDERPSLSESKDRSPLRQAWDDVYWHSYPPTQKALPGLPLVQVCLALQDVAADDPAVEWLILRAVALMRNETVSHYFDLLPMPPGELLDNATIDRLLASLRRLWKHDEVLEWSGRSPFVEMVARELRRAGRDDDWLQLLTEAESLNAEAAAPSLNLFGWLIQNAARRNDTDVAVRLVKRYANDLAANPSLAININDQHYANPGFIALWMQNLMIRPTDATGSAASPDASRLRVLKVVDAAWGPLSDRHLPPDSSSTIRYLINLEGGASAGKTAPRQLTQTQRQSIADSGQGWLVWQNADRFQPRTVNFPNVIKAPEFAALRVLMQAHVIAVQGGWSAALHEHLQSKAAAAKPQSREKYMALLGLASLLMWEEQTDAALPVMRDLFDAAGHSTQLQFDIAWQHQHHGHNEAALDLFDRIDAKNGSLRKEIEQRAVSLAAKLSKPDRVRLAAERLFGMKLEPQEELQLAATLSGLGLHDHAEAIRMRLPQRAGNNLLALQQLMDDHSAAKRIDEACAVAEQIVRRTAPANPLIGSAQQSTFSGGVQAKIITQHSVARTKALTLLGRNGRLEPMIAQAEAQFERSQSLKLFGLLAELYAADVGQVSNVPGSDDKKPDGQVGNLPHERMAKLVVRLADSEAADPQFRLTLARALVSAGQAKLAVPHFLFAIERLPNATAQVLFEVEQILSELGQTEELAHIVLKSKLAVNDQQRVELFHRIVQRLHGPPIRAKLIIDLFEKAFREAPKFRPMLSAQLLALSGSVWQQEELWPLARDLAVPPETLKNPGAWYGIDIVNKPAASPVSLLTLNVIELAKQIGKLEELETHTTAAMKSHPDWTLGGSVTLGLINLRQRGQIQQAKPLLQALFHGSVGTTKLAYAWGGNIERTQNFDLLTCGLGHELSVAGQIESAVSFYELTSPELALEECRLFGKEPAMQQLAVRIVNRMLAKLDNSDELARQAGSPLFAEAAKIMAEINQPYSAARLAQAMITRWQLPGANNSDGGVWLRQLEDRFASARAAIPVGWMPLPDSAEGGQATIDLLIHVTGDSLATLRLDSPFARRMGAPARPAEASTKDDKPNKGAAKDRPGKRTQPPLSLAILNALTELLDPDSTSRAAVEQLLTIAKSKQEVIPPRTAPPGFHPQLGLWLVARECLRRDDLKPLGEQLADLAAETASQHFDPRFRWAILRERGELALKAGDKQLASKLWSQLAETMLRPKTKEDFMAVFTGGHLQWSADWQLIRLQRARDLCQVVLNADLPDLSLRIFRDAVNWPKDATLSDGREQIHLGELTFFTDEKTISHGDGVAESLLAKWNELESEWRTKGVEPDEIFVALLECVFPSSRPNDVFVFGVPPMAEATRKESRPNSMALRLVELAVTEKRTDSLTKKLATREMTATNPLAIRLIWLLLAQQSNDNARLTSELAKLEQHEWSKTANFDGRVATHIVSRLISLAESNKTVAELLEQLVPQLAKANSRDEHPLAELRRWLARRQLASLQTDKAKETISAHLRHMDQVWSAAGAMDGQHLRRLGLLTLAEVLSSAGLTLDALDLLAQVADARWPDKFPDENPGSVLTFLEAKLKTLPAQERYELWRNWTLPNDGLKSMRMLTGAVKLETRNPKSEGNDKSEILILKSTGLLLVEAAREAKRLPELAALVEQHMKQRPNDRLHVLLALTYLANEAPMSAEPFLRKQLAGSDGQGTRSSTTRTRIWDDWLLSQQATHESLREITVLVADRALAGAKELHDEALQSLATSKK